MVRPQRRVVGRLVAGVVAVAFAACATPPDSVALTLDGSVVDASGAPVAGATVEGRTALDPRDIDTPRLNELDSLALACVDERPPPACHSGRRTETSDAAGAFRVELLEGDLEGGPGVVSGPEALDVVAQPERDAGDLSAPAVSRRLTVGSSDTALEPFVLWDPGLELTTETSGDAVLRWSGDPPARVTAYRVLVEASSGKLVWTEETGARELTLRLAELEGTRGAVSVVALGASEPQYWRSARVPYRADDGTVRLAGVDEVGWPFPRSLSQTVVLVAIVALLLASSLLVVTGGVRHRRQLLKGPGLRVGRR